MWFLRIWCPQEVVHAFTALQKALDSASKGTIPFENFPEEMQKKLRLLDDTGDGQLDAQEILAGIEALQREKDRAAMLKKAVIGLSAFIFFLLILIGLVMGIVLEITRQTGLKGDANGDAVMRSKGGQVVATASSETQVSSDGAVRVKTKPSPSTRRAGATFSSSLLQTKSATRLGTWRRLHLCLQGPHTH